MTWTYHESTVIKSNPNDAYTIEEAQQKFAELQEEAYNAMVFRDAAQETLTEAEAALTAAEAERDELETVLNTMGETPILYTQWSTD